MAVGVHIGGAPEFKALAVRMEKAANGGLVIDEVGAAVDRLVPQVEAAIKSGAERLPTSGGLAALVAQTELTRKVTRYEHEYSVKLRARKNAVRDPAAINRGRVRHPVRQRKVEKERGRKAVWVLQMVPPGWFSDPPKKLTPEIRVAVEKAVHDALGKV